MLKNQTMEVEIVVCIDVEALNGSMEKKEQEENIYEARSTSPTGAGEAGMPKGRSTVYVDRSGVQCGGMYINHKNFGPYCGRCVEMEKENGKISFYSGEKHLLTVRIFDPEEPN